MVSKSLHDDLPHCGNPLCDDYDDGDDMGQPDHH